MPALNRLRAAKKVASTTASPLTATTKYVKSLTIKNPGAGGVFVGGPNVSDTEGFRIANGEIIEIVPDPNEIEIDLNDVYVMTNSGTSDIYFFYVLRE